MASAEPTLGDIRCENERIAAVLAVVSEQTHEALNEMTGEERDAQLYRCWLLLDLARSCFERNDHRLGEAEKALLAPGVGQ